MMNSVAKSAKTRRKGAPYYKGALAIFAGATGIDPTTAGAKTLAHRPGRKT